MDTTLQCWTEWKRRCALNSCSDDAKRMLRGFAAKRFKGYVQKFLFRTNLTDARAAALEGGDAWHLLETSMVAGSARGGKSYKDWLFARTKSSRGEALAAIEGGATLLMRSVVREVLKNEYSPPTSLSLATPVRAGDGSITVEDMLPGTANPSSEAELNELRNIAVQHAATHFSDMPRREKITMMARHNGIALSHPAVLKAARRGKSMLTRAYHESIQRLSSRMLIEHPQEDRKTVLTLALMAAEEVGRLASEWGKSEISCARFFTVVERGIAK